jgi:hypothetical protein
MNIESGLFEGIVLQRDAKNRSNQPITGTTEARGDVVASVKGARGFAGKKIGQAKNGRFFARLSGLPVGGPYRVVLRIGDEKIVVQDVYVGDLWIAAGQSNMQGVGRLEFAAKPIPQVRAFYMDDVWRPAKDPIHNMWDCVDQCHITISGGRPARMIYKGTGPAVGFAQEMWRRTKIPQGVIACAHGGTSMAQWSPATPDDGGQTLYGATIRRLRKNGGRAAGVIWYQGESDAVPQSVDRYTERMKELVRAFRRDSGNATLPFAIVQISRVVADWESRPEWNKIQEQQRLLPRVIKHLATVPAIDLMLDDLIHIGGPDVNRLGRRLAEAMLTLKPPIELGKVRIVVDPANGVVADLHVQFKNVQGRLIAPGRPYGFALTKDGQQVPAIYDTQLKGDTVIVRTSRNPVDLGLNLHYGSWCDPYCNITDEGDRSLPVFGPVTVGSARAVTPFVRSMRVSPFLPGAGNLKALPKSLDGALQSLEWREVESPQDFFGLRPEIVSHGGEDRLAYLAFKLEAPEPMKLRMLFGYDGPVKVWIGGRQVFHDPNGTNPSRMDARSIRIDAKPGTHDVTIALGTNEGRAWGVFVRFERTDVPARLRRQGPGAYVLPTITR